MSRFEILAGNTRNMVDVGKRYAVPRALSTAHRTLMQTHAALKQEFETLRGDPFDLPGHRDYLRKVRAHLEALHKHTTDLLSEGERLHEERVNFHVSHRRTPLHPSPGPRLPRRRPASKP